VETTEEKLLGANDQPMTPFSYLVKPSILLYFFVSDENA
jgi:hypothetical protein